MSNGTERVNMKIKIIIFLIIAGMILLKQTQLKAAESGAVNLKNDNSNPTQLNAYQLIPEGWRVEVIPFPLDFASNIPLVGVEELLFAPGMFKPEAEDFFSYAFVWYVEEVQLDHKLMQNYLQQYYAGLGKSVSGVEQAQASVIIDPSSSEKFLTGTVHWVEPFKTKQKQRLFFEARLIPCDQTSKLRWYFVVSPQPKKHSVWQTLKALKTKDC